MPCPVIGSSTGTTRRLNPTTPLQNEKLAFPDSRTLEFNVNSDETGKRIRGNRKKCRQGVRADDDLPESVDARTAGFGLVDANAVLICQRILQFDSVKVIGDRSFMPILRERRAEFLLSFAKRGYRVIATMFSVVISSVFAEKWEFLFWSVHQHQSSVSGCLP